MPSTPVLQLAGRSLPLLRGQLSYHHYINQPAKHLNQLRLLRTPLPRRLASSRPTRPYKPKHQTPPKKPETTFSVFSHLSKRETWRNVYQTVSLMLFVTFAASFVSQIVRIATSGSEMSSSLIPSGPSDVMVIRDVTPNVVTLSVPFLRFGKIPVGGRGTIVRLTSGALAVFSPVALTPEVKEKLAGLGNKLQYIIAPDIEHHIFISDWKAAFPDAKLICVEGLPEKRLRQNDPKIGKEPFDVVFTAGNKRTISISPEFDADFSYEYVDGHANQELVFYYRPDRVLIEADLMFNLPATEQYSRVPEADRPKPGFLARQFMSVQSTQGDAKDMKRLIWWGLSRGNRQSFNESVKRIDEWDFAILVPCHGDVIEEGAKETFEKVFDWHLNGKK